MVLRHSAMLVAIASILYVFLSCGVLTVDAQGLSVSINNGDAIDGVIGSNTTVTCSTTGATNVTWLAPNGFTINPALAASKYSINFNSITGISNLTIISIATSDSGSYICRATDSFGQSLSDSIQLSAVTAALYEPSIQSDSLYAIEGDNFTLVCEVSSMYAEAEVYWRLDGQILTTSCTRSVFFGTQYTKTCLYTRTNVQRSDNSKVFYCLASVPGTDKQKKWTMSVTVRPTIPVITRTSATVQVGLTASWTCRTSGGNPTPTLIWQLDLTQVSNGGSYNIPASTVTEQTINGYTTYTVTNAISWILVSQDIGKLLYCKISSLPAPSNAVAILVINTSTTVTVEILNGDSVSANEGQSITLTCRVVGTGSITVNWFGPKSISGSKYTVIPYSSNSSQSRLTISNLDSSDAGTYMCLARSSASSANFSDLITLAVTAPLSVDITNGLTVTGTPGQSITLTCTVTGLGTITVSWNGLTGAQLLTNSKYTVGAYDTNSRQSNLTINSLTTSDAGTYTCRGSDSSGNTLLDTVQLIVTAPLSVHITNGPTVTATQGQSVTLTCEVTGSGAIGLMWIGTTGGQLFTNFKYNVGAYNSNTGQSTLTVNSIKASDAGAYKCRGSDSSGTQEDSTQLTFIVACPTLELNDTISSTPISIPFTRINLTGYSWNRCYPGSRAFASALCLGDYYTGARWGDVTFAKDCQQAPNLENSNQSLLLRNLSKTLVDINNVNQVINDTAILTSARDSLKDADVIYTAQILENLQQISSLPSKALNDVIKVANNMLELDPGIIRSAQKISSAANRILRAVDDLTQNTDLLGQNSRRIVQPYVAAEIWEQTQPNIIGLELIQGESKRIENGSLSTLKTAPDNLQKTDAAIYIDPKLVQGSSSRLAMQVYWDNKMFTDNSGRYETISRIAAARLFRNGKSIVDLVDKTVTAIFLPFKEHMDIVCGYWNYTGNENAGGWSTEGCIHNVDTGRHICKCNHLTNFAVLIDLQPDRTISDADKLALGIITKIGLGLSIVGLGLTILSFLIFRNLRKSYGQKTLVCLCFAMLGSAILFLVGIDRTESYGGCITVSILLHYFILVSFMWMLIEGSLQYLRFVKVLGTYIPKFMIKTSIPAWGTPLIPVIVLLAVNYNLYYGGRGYCWMQLYPLYWAFILPIGLILVANFIVFILVIVNLCRRHRGMQVNQSDYKITVMKFQAGLAVFVLLGLTWVFGFLAVEDARVAFMYVFAFLNAFQGFFVFLLFSAREKQVRQSWARLCCKKKSDKTSTSTSDSRGQQYSIPLSQSTNLSDERSLHA